MDSRFSCMCAVIFTLPFLLSKHVLKYSSLLLYSSLSTGRGPPLSHAFVVMRAVTLTLVRVGSHVSPLVETESASFPLGKVGSVFLRTSLSHVSFTWPLLIPSLFSFCWNDGEPISGGLSVLYCIITVIAIRIIEILESGMCAISLSRKARAPSLLITAYCEL